MNRTKPKSLILTYVSLFAALNALADIAPFTPILGVPGASLRFGWITSPLTGILLGTRMGGISCLIAGLVGSFLNQPLVFGPFTPLRPAISASVTGMLVHKNWRVPAITLFLLILIWLLLPVGRDASVVLIFHVVGLAAILLLRGKIGDFVTSRTSRRNSLGLFLCAYCGNVSRHLFGNILLATMQNLQPMYFISAAPITLIEQTTFAIGTMIVGGALLRVGLGQPQQL